MPRRKPGAGKPQYRRYRARDLVVTSDLPKKIYGVLPWEPELLAPVVGEMVASMLEDADSQPAGRAGQPGEIERQLRRECHRLGVVIERQTTDKNGDVLLRCRIPGRLP